MLIIFQQFDRSRYPSSVKKRSEEPIFTSFLREGTENAVLAFLFPQVDGIASGEGFIETQEI